MTPDTPIPFPTPISKQGTIFTYSVPELLIHFTKVTALLQFETNKIENGLNAEVKKGQLEWAKFRCAFDRSAKCTDLLKTLAMEGQSTVCTNQLPTNGKTFLESYAPEAKLEA